ncbi:5-formyltetrahydrofolate cyclo-ligase [Pedobacter alpinus]|uniref:5-formyltetrahydrofolate cyclo-ligase n=1 Tax=Pedobacter alpinus TaxID=1590643 RepID=A0ABW5TTC3_9SPHI
MDKLSIRNKAIAERNSLSRANFWQLNDDLLRQFTAFNWSEIKCVHLFLPITERKEVDTFEFINFFKIKFSNIKLVVSRTDFKNNIIIPIIFDPENTVLVKNKYQIPEPLYGKQINGQEIDAVIVPLLAFDKEGHRVGYGAGFYDRFLAQCKPAVLKIGVSLFDPIESIIETNTHDVKLTHCITPTQTFSF